MNRITRRTLIACTIALLLAPPLALSAAERVDMTKRAAELKNLKWGMFICWSFSTFSGKEWTPGVKDLKLFAATDCDTDQWARTAQEAGMGYILFLTKHHDGFCLWDTQTTDRHQARTLFFRGRVQGQQGLSSRRVHARDEEGAAQGTAHPLRPH